MRALVAQFDKMLTQMKLVNLLYGIIEGTHRTGTNRQTGTIINPSRSKGLKDENDTSQLKNMGWHGQYKFRNLLLV